MRHRRPRMGFTLVDLIAGSVIATVLAAAFLTLQLSVTRGVGAINEHAIYQITLIQATDRIQQDVLTATQALPTWNGLTEQQNSTLVVGAVARWILEVPEMNAAGSSAPLAHVVYEYLGGSQTQLKRIYYAPGTTSPTTTQVVANAVINAGFLACTETSSANVYTKCVEMFLQTRLKTPTLAPRSTPVTSTSTPTRRVRANYRNSPPSPS